MRGDPGGGEVLGLLGVAVVIALLRALGLTRRQLRRVLAAEGLLLALVAALVVPGGS